MVEGSARGLVDFPDLVVKPVVVVVVEVPVFFYPVHELLELELARLLVDLVGLEDVAGILLRQVLDACRLDLHIVLPHFQRDHRPFVVHVFVQLLDDVGPCPALDFVRPLVAFLEGELRASNEVVLHVVGTYADQPSPA